METFSALLALYAGNFPAQRPVTRSFDVFFDLRLNKRLSKQPWGWWFETPAWSLWRHRNEKWIPNNRWYASCLLSFVFSNIYHLLLISIQQVTYFCTVLYKCDMSVDISWGYKCYKCSTAMILLTPRREVRLEQGDFKIKGLFEYIVASLPYHNFCRIIIITVTNMIIIIIS